MIWHSLSRVTEASKEEMEKLRGLGCEHDHLKERRVPPSGLAMAVTRKEDSTNKRRRKLMHLAHPPIAMTEQSGTMADDPVIIIIDEVINEELIRGGATESENDVNTKQ